MEQAVIDPVAPSVLKAELKEEYRLCETSHGGFEVYLIDGTTAPSVLTEIGRIRELAFRSNGGGTGKSVDLDRFDLEPELGFRQLVLWDPEREMIAGGYRILTGNRCRFGEDGQPLMPSAHLFRFSDAFMKDVIPGMVELSRSFITASFMNEPASARNVFALDGLFEGICYAVAPEKMRWFFGKVTFYPDYPLEALSLIHAFFTKYAADPRVVPHTERPMLTLDYAPEVLCGDSFKADFRALKLYFRKRGFYIPPILNTYINLSDSFRYFGNAVNDEFGNVTEMGLLVDMSDIQAERYRSLLNV